MQPVTEDPASKTILSNASVGNAGTQTEDLRSRIERIVNMRLVPGIDDQIALLIIDSGEKGQGTLEILKGSLEQTGLGPVMVVDTDTFEEVPEDILKGLEVPQRTRPVILFNLGMKKFIEWQDKINWRKIDWYNFEDEEPEAPKRECAPFVPIVIMCDRAEAEVYEFNHMRCSASNIGLYICDLTEGETTAPEWRLPLAEATLQGDIPQRFLDTLVNREGFLPAYGLSSALSLWPERAFLQDRYFDAALKAGYSPRPNALAYSSALSHSTHLIYFEPADIDRYLERVREEFFGPLRSSLVSDSSCAVASALGEFLDVLELEVTTLGARFRYQMETNSEAIGKPYVPGTRVGDVDPNLRSNSWERLPALDGQVLEMGPDLIPASGLLQRLWDADTGWLSILPPTMHIEDRLAVSHSNIRVLQALDRLEGALEGLNTDTRKCLLSSLDAQIKDLYASFGNNILCSKEGEFVSINAFQWEMYYCVLDPIEGRNSCMHADLHSPGAGFNLGEANRDLLREYSHRFWNHELWKDSRASRTVSPEYTLKFFSGTEQAVFKNAFEAIHLAPSESPLIDFGCGRGDFFNYGYRNRDVYGVDLSPQMVKVARHRGFSGVDCVDMTDIERLDEWYHGKVPAEKRVAAVSINVLQDLSCEGRRNFMSWLLENVKGTIFLSVIFEHRTDEERQDVEESITKAITGSGIAVTQHSWERDAARVKREGKYTFYSIASI